MTNVEDMTHVPEAGKTNRLIRRFDVYSVLLLVALIVLRGVVVPQCKEIYANYGTKLPGTTLAVLAVLEHNSSVLIGMAILVTAGVSSRISRAPLSSPLRHYAWIIPVAGLAATLLLLLFLTLPLLP